MEAVDANGNVIMTVKNYLTVKLGELPTEYLFPKIVMEQVSINAIQQEYTDAADDDIKKFINSAELATYRRFKVDKKRYEWLAGRIAAKKAVCAYFADIKPLSPVIIEIKGAAKEAPMVVIDDDAIDAAKVEQLSLSITHSHGIAAAVVTDRTLVGLIGIDIEKIAPRDPHLLEGYFSAAEREYIEGLAKIAKDAFDQLVTTFWSIKEAVSKALGMGLKIDFSAIEVRMLAPNRFEARLRDDAQKKAKELGYENLTLKTFESEGYAWSLAILAK
jgi:phosphopantetheine--protein transferase-like protein